MGASSPRSGWERRYNTFFVISNHFRTDWALKNLIFFQAFFTAVGINAIDVSSCFRIISKVLPTSY